MLNLNKKGHISELVGYSGIFIGSEVNANGDITTEEDVFIDGKYSGKLQTSGAVEIGKNAQYTGSITSRSAVLEGIIKAYIIADESIQITGCSQLKGSITSKNITIDPGAVINIKASTK
jgi:hypothetical protein